jgi:hypothetical protein
LVLIHLKCILIIHLVLIILFGRILVWFTLLMIILVMINRYVMIMKECLLIKCRNIIRTIWLLTIFICQKTFLIFLHIVLIFILYFLILTLEYSSILDIYILAKGIIKLIILLLKLLEKGLTRFDISTVNILIPKILLRVV